MGYCGSQQYNSGKYQRQCVTGNTRFNFINESDWI